jgi:hypothetical protein
MTQDRWFELRTGTPANAGMHCLIRLNHPRSPCNSQERWDIAAELATAVLGRFPTPDELKPIGTEAVAEFTGFVYHLMFLKGSVVGLKPPRKTGHQSFWVKCHQCHKPKNATNEDGQKPA